jgi:hypothetical protein
MDTMGEHKHNLVAEYYKKHPRARHLPLSFKSMQRKPRAKPVKLPEGRFIIKNTVPFTCDHCGKNPFIGEIDEEDK